MRRYRIPVAVLALLQLELSVVGRYQLPPAVRDYEGSQIDRSKRFGGSDVDEKDCLSYYKDLI